MFRRNKTIIASIVVGVLGAAIAGLLALAFPWMSDNPKPVKIAAITQLTVPMGIISGFLSCFVTSRRYLKSMENQSWREGRGSGVLYGGWAGAVSGFVTAFVWPFAEKVYYKDYEFYNYVLYPLLGAWFGFLFGIATGFVLAIIFAPFVLKFIVGTPKDS